MKGKMWKKKRKINDEDEEEHGIREHELYLTCFS